MSSNTRPFDLDDPGDGFETGGRIQFDPCILSRRHFWRLRPCSASETKRTEWGPMPDPIPALTFDWCSPPVSSHNSSPGNPCWGPIKLRSPATVIISLKPSRKSCRELPWLEGHPFFSAAVPLQFLEKSSLYELLRSGMELKAISIRLACSDDNSDSVA